MAADGKDAIPTEADYQRVLQQVRDNDASLVSVNLNNLEKSKPEWMNDLVAALQTNTTVTVLSLVNCAVGNDAAKALAEVLKTNPTLQNINVETNSIGNEGVRAIAEAVEVNTTLLELKLANQAQMLGTDIERLLAAAIEKSPSLIKVSVAFREQNSRNVMDRAISRNKEAARKARQAAKAAASS